MSNIILKLTKIKKTPCIISCDQAPSNLKSQIVQSQSTKPNTKSTRRNVYNEVITEKFGQLTFDYFFSKLKSNLHTNDFKNTFSSFKNLIMSNMYTNFPIFINLFARFNVEYRIISTFYIFCVSLCAQKETQKKALFLP